MASTVILFPLDLFCFLPCVLFPLTLPSCYLFLHHIIDTLHKTVSLASLTSLLTLIWDSAKTRKHLDLLVNNFRLSVMYWRENTFAFLKFNQSLNWTIFKCGYTASRPTKDIDDFPSFQMMKTFCNPTSFKSLSDIW